MIVFFGLQYSIYLYIYKDEYEEKLLYHSNASLKIFCNSYIS